MKRRIEGSEMAGRRESRHQVSAFRRFLSLSFSGSRRSSFSAVYLGICLVESLRSPKKANCQRLETTESTRTTMRRRIQFMGSANDDFFLSLDLCNSLSLSKLSRGRKKNSKQEERKKKERQVSSKARVHVDLAGRPEILMRERDVDVSEKQRIRR